MDPNHSGANTAYALWHLANSPQYYKLALEEVTAVCAAHNGGNLPLPLAQQLADFVPLEAWESEFPVLEASLKESIRLHGLAAAFRKNSIQDETIPHSGELVPKGVVLAYHAADVHLDESIYANPLIWDPDRFRIRREDTKVELGFIGFGGGRHPCLGRRVS